MGLLLPSSSREIKSAMYMMVQIDEPDVAAAMAAVSQFAIGEPLLLARWEGTPLAGVADVAAASSGVIAEEDLAIRIADALRPTSGRPLRRDTLRVFFGKEHIQGGVFLRHPGGNDALRNGMVAVAKALRPFVPRPKPPIDLLAEREKEYAGGGYRRVVYKLNPLGQRVRTLMEERGDL